MSKFYKARKTWGIFDPASKEPFKVSRSKIDLFMQCPRCFYLDQRLGVARPPGFPFTLNSAVDKLMKKEFDIHRAKQTAHPLMTAYKIEAVPFNDPRMEEWRDAMRRGIAFHHKETNFFVRGGVDDIWINPQKELIVVDYKATSKDEEVTLDDEWKVAYKRQMEIYQWLFKQNDFAVSETGYFVYVNGKTDREAFDGKLEFDVSIIPYKGKTDWIPGVLKEMKECLVGPKMPRANSECDYCNYRKEAMTVAQEEIKAGKKEKVAPASVIPVQTRI